MIQSKKPTVSIIVPVYNTEKYLYRCLNSIRESNFSDFEVIVVDDGSTDSSFSVCDEFAQMDARFQVIHTENFGVSHARNVGLDNAKGKFIVFIDSDDVIGKNRIGSILLPEGIDIIFGKYTNVSRNDKRIVCYCETSLMIIDDYRRAIHNNINLKPSVVWNGCYSRKLIEDNNLRFDLNKKIGEDILFNLNYLEFCQKIGFVDNYEYYHYNIETSLLHLFYQDRTNHEIEELQAIENFCRTVNYRNRYYIWHKTIDYFSNYAKSAEVKLRTTAKEQMKKCYQNIFFKESIPVIRSQGTFDEIIETYLMGYYRHKLYNPIIKILKYFKH